MKINILIFPLSASGFFIGNINSYLKLNDRSACKNKKYFYNLDTRFRDFYNY